MQKASSRFPIERFPGRVASGIVEAGFRSRLYLRYIVNACQRGCESVNRPTEAIVFIRGRKHCCRRSRKGGKNGGIPVVVEGTGGSGKSGGTKKRKWEEGSEECETRARLHASNRVLGFRGDRGRDPRASFLFPCHVNA